MLKPKFSFNLQKKDPDVSNTRFHFLIIDLVSILFHGENCIIERVLIKINRCGMILNETAL